MEVETGLGDISETRSETKKERTKIDDLYLCQPHPDFGDKEESNRTLILH